MYVLFSFFLSLSLSHVDTLRMLYVRGGLLKVQRVAGGAHCFCSTLRSRLQDAAKKQRARELHQYMAKGAFRLRFCPFFCCRVLQ